MEKRVLVLVCWRDQVRTGGFVELLLVVFELVQGVHEHFLEVMPHVHLGVYYINVRSIVNYNRHVDRPR